MNQAHCTLLLGLLAAIAPACKDAGKSSTGGEPSSGAPSGSAPRAHVMVKTSPQPPFARVAGVSSAPFAATAPGDKPFRDCDPEYRAWPEEMSGEPHPSTYCYLPATNAACLPLTSPALPRVLAVPQGSVGSCIFAEDRAHPDPDPATGQPRCCYTTWRGGMGRPLLVGLAPRRAPLVASAWG